LIKNNSKEYVLLSFGDYNSLIESNHLLQNPENAKWLGESIQQAEDENLISLGDTDEKYFVDA